MIALDIPAVQAFMLVSELQSFTRAAETLGSTQAAISMKLQRLESLLGRRLLERSPRSVKLTSDGLAFRDDARLLIDAHDRALHGGKRAIRSLKLGISDHAAGSELVPLLEKFQAISADFTLAVTIGFSRSLTETFDAGDLDALIVRQEAGRRGGELLATDAFGWFAAPRFRWTRGETLRLATLASPCAVRAVAIRALEKSRLPFSEVFMGGGVAAVVAAAEAGLAVAPMARRIAPAGLVDIGPASGFPKLPLSKVLMHSNVSDPERLAALRLLAATFRSLTAS